MIKVYFESKNHAELVAVFDTDEQYDICSDALEKQATEQNMILTESCNDESLTDLIDE